MLEKHIRHLLYFCKENELGENGMKRIVCLALVLLMLAAACVVAAAETTTAQGNGFTDVPFANGYSGFCIDADLTGAYIGDSFSVANDTSVATSNKTGEDISQKLKLLFTLCFEDIFVLDDNGSYVLDNLDTDTVIPAIVYYYSDHQTAQVWGDRKTMVEKIDGYMGSQIPDEGYELTLDNGDVVTFYFSVLEPIKEGAQSFFTYKVETRQTGTTPTYTVKFDANGGEGTMADQEFEADKAEKLTANAFTRDGYMFTGWNTNADGSGTSYTDEESVTNPGNVTLFAQWQKNPYQVTVTNDGNGTGYANPASGATGTEVTLSAAPKEGYQFKAWEVVSGGVTVADNKFTIGTQNVEIKAIFEEIPEEYDVTVSFEGVGAVVPNPASAAEGEEVTLHVEAGSGYRLVSLTVNGEEKAGDVQNNLYIFKMPKGDVEIQAVFEAIPADIYTVAFNANGGSGEMANQTFDGGVKQPLRKNTFIRSGYTFIGWNTKADGTGTAYTDEQSVTVAGNMTLYAIWEKDAGLLRITRQPQDQFVTEGQKAEFAVEAEGDGLTYQWYVDRGDGKGLVELKGAEDASYVTSATNLSNDGYVYVCKVTDENGHTVTSEAAVLHVSELPVLPQTGDSSAPALYLVLGVLSVLGLAVLGKRSCIR